VGIRLTEINSVSIIKYPILRIRYPETDPDKSSKFLSKPTSHPPSLNIPSTVLNISFKILAALNAVQKSLF
jgi:hypothetical protein